MEMRLNPGGRSVLLVCLIWLLPVGDLSWAVHPQRQRGGYGGYDEPARWPTLVAPDSATLAPMSKTESMAVQADLERAEELLGRQVISKEGALLGQVRAIVLHKQDQALQVVVALGGRLGFGAKKVVAPLGWLELESRAEGNQAAAVFDQDVEALQQLPVYRPEAFDVIEPRLAGG